MQQQNPPPVASPGKIAFRYGLILGLIQTVLALITALVTALTDPLGTSAGLSFGLGVLIFITSLVAYFIAGTLAAKQTGKVSTGTIGGLWTGVVYGILGCIITSTTFLAIRYPKLIDHYNTVGYPANATASAFKVGLVAAGVGLPVFGLFLAIGVGAGIGALGGLLGRSQFRKNTPQQPYPNQPYPNQPIKSSLTHHNPILISPIKGNLIQGNPILTHNPILDNRRTLLSNQRHHLQLIGTRTIPTSHAKN